MSELKPAELMKAMGSKKGFDPIPPDQHAWTLAEGMPPLFRLWGWMCAHTIRKGHRRQYAVNADGSPATIEQAARDLKVDPAGCRRTWREGMSLGLWRKGTHAKDKRCLYFNGEVLPVTLEPDEEMDTEKVCTDLLPPYISKQIKELSKENREKFILRYTRNLELKQELHADLTAATRFIFDHREDNIFSDFGIKKIRDERKSEEKTKERVSRVFTILPGLERFVQSLDQGTVQTQEDFVQSGNSRTVQTGRTRAVATEERVSLGEASSSSAVSLSAAAKRKAEEEDPPTFATLKALYPRQQFDEGKSRVLFEKLPVAERAQVIRQLRVYLNCARWLDSGGEWIPLCSNWLPIYAAAPPPLVKKKTGKKGFYENMMEEAAEHLAKTGSR